MVSKNLIGVLVPLGIILLIGILGMFDLGLSVDVTTVPTVSYDALFPPLEMNDSCGSSYPYAPGALVNQHRIVLQTITVRNDFFLGRVKQLPYVTACFSPWSTYGATPYIEVLVDGVVTNTYDISMNGIEIPAHSEKTVQLTLTPYCEYRYDLEKPKYVSPAYNVTEILLIPSPDSFETYVDCYSLSQEQRASALAIPVVR